jgi:class 3 adenylate cyclase
VSTVPSIGRLLDLALRHHIDGVRQHFEAALTGVSDRPWLRLGVGFADLSGFTSTTLSLDLDQLDAMVTAFERRVVEVVAAHGGRVVKFVGDAALFVCSDPDALAEAGLALVHADDADGALPVRAGMAYGTVLARDGDYFGPTVNLAARLVDVADRHQVVIDEGLRDAVASSARWDAEALPPATLRGIPDPVVPYALRRA